MLNFCPAEPSRMIAIARRPIREYVDFAHVSVAHWKIHDDLENWARWCRGREGRDTAPASPMFALYRSTDAKREERLYGELTAVPVDKIKAQFTAKAVAVLPDKHRRAIHWCYLHPRNPSAMAKELGVGLEGLSHLVHNARQMLINRLDIHRSAMAQSGPPAEQ